MPDLHRAPSPPSTIDPLAAEKSQRGGGSASLHPARISPGTAPGLCWVKPHSSSFPSMLGTTCIPQHPSFVPSTLNSLGTEQPAPWTSILGCSPPFVQLAAGKERCCVVCAPGTPLSDAHKGFWLLRSHKVPSLTQQLRSHLLMEPANGSPEDLSVLLPPRCLVSPAWNHTLKPFPSPRWFEHLTPRGRSR